MSTTIFCTFDQQDIADLAIGRLRSTVTGIQSIEYLTDFGSQVSNSRDDGPLFLGWPNANAYGFNNGAGVQPSRPVSVKIVCNDSAKDMIMGRLVNLHAYRIVAS